MKITQAKGNRQGQCTYVHYEGKEGVYCKNCADELRIQDVVKRRAGTPIEDYEPLYNCENWIP